MMSMADKPPAYTAIDNIPQPFFLSCFNKYPKALGFFRETNDLFSIASKPNVYTLIQPLTIATLQTDQRENIILLV